jgi:hypothetical protein
MFPKIENFLGWVVLGILLLTGCGAPTQTATLEPERVDDLTISLLYPTESSEIKMGQTIKTIVRITDQEGHPVADASVTVFFSDPEGQPIGSAPAVFGDGDVYRSASWTMPHRMKQGLWTINTEAEGNGHQGQSTNYLKVVFSTSEVLYNKYGFWLDAPTLRGIQPSIMAERGDSQNGFIRWGGQIPSQHILPDNWVEVQWRKGDFKLGSSEAVRKFMMTDIGDFGFTPIREIDTFRRIKFKRWDAWEAPARGQLSYQEVKWTVFYAPEVDKTFVLGTIVTQAPSNIEAHEALLENFDIDSNVMSEGVAPEPLISLLPKPELVSPDMGARFSGLGQPIVLKWEPLKELADDEYYQVAVDYNYKETNTTVKYATHETQFMLPEELYRLPNCAVFNWRVTLMQQIGVDKAGNPTGNALSYDSLYRYVRWFYPPDEKAPFDPHCPNAQY